jgi:hypothetical protein
MFEAVYDAMVAFLEYAWCWIINSCVDLATFLMELVSSVMPSIGVPSWLHSSLNFTSEGLQMIGWVVPTGAFAWCMTGWIVFEMIFMIVLPLYRALMDLL